MPEIGNGKRRVLVVEDDPDTREYLRVLLAASGFETDVAADADGARSLALARPPHALLVDLSLPRESGASLLRDLRARGVAIPALLVTAHPSPPAEIDGAPIVVVRKPFGADELIRALETELRRSA